MEFQERRYRELDRLITTFIVASGVLGQVFLYMILGIQVEDVPAITMIILWIAISGIVKEVVERVLY